MKRGPDGSLDPGGQIRDHLTPPHPKPATRQKALNRPPKEKASTGERPTTLLPINRARRPRGVPTGGGGNASSKRRVDRTRHSTTDPATRRSNANLHHRRRSPVLRTSTLNRRVEMWISNPLLVTDRELDALEILLSTEQDG